MRRLLFLSLLFVVGVLSSFAVETNGIFGFKQQDNAAGYQQYVGQEFKLREAHGTLETWKKTGLDIKPEMYDNIYVVTKITVKDVEVNKKNNKEVTVEAVQKGTKKKIKFKGYEEVAVKLGFWGDIKQWPLIGHMPIILLDSFNEFASKHVGETITNSAVKDQYEVTEVFVGGKDLAEPWIVAKNKRTGVTSKSAYSTASVDLFTEALRGRYRLSLTKVEKPEDSSDRYGETQVVQDNGVDKYSYKDENIDILIFGTSEEFKFTLKNVSNHSLKLIWNEAAFVGLDGSSSKIMHVGIKYSQREADQPATTIIKGAKIEDLATPTANVYYDEGIGTTRIGSGWKTKSMLPSSYKGKEAGEIRLMLPIQIKDVVNEYTFVFKVYYSYDHPELLNTEAL